MWQQFDWIPIHQLLSRARISQTHSWAHQLAALSAPAPLKSTESHRNLGIRSRHLAHQHWRPPPTTRRCKSLKRKCWRSVIVCVKSDSAIHRTRVLTMCWSILKIRTSYWCDCARIWAMSWWRFSERRRKFVIKWRWTSRSSCCIATSFQSMLEGGFIVVSLSAWATQEKNVLIIIAFTYISPSQLLFLNLIVLRQLRAMKQSFSNLKIYKKSNNDSLECGLIRIETTKWENNVKVSQHKKSKKKQANLKLPMSVNICKLLKNREKHILWQKQII